MYRLVFDGYLDHLLRHRGASRRHAALWYPDRSMAEQAAARMRALGQAVSIEQLGAGGLSDARLAGGGGRPGTPGRTAQDGPLVMPEDA